MQGSSMLPPCSRLSQNRVFSPQKTLLQASSSRSRCDFEAAFCDFSQRQTHATLQGTSLLVWGFFWRLLQIQCPRIMDKLQPREFNSAPTPCGSEPVSAGCSYNKRLYYSLSSTWQVLNLENWFVQQRLLLRVAC